MTPTVTDRALEGYGIVDLPRETVGELLCSRTEHHPTFEVVDEADGWASAERFLQRLTHPATRLVVLSLGNASLLINNRRGGSDPGDLIRVFASRAGVRTARVVDSASRVWTNGLDREVVSYGARIFEMYDAAGALERSVACADDGGRWTFSESGTPHPIERTFDSGARRKRDRFTSANLRTLIGAYGLPLVTRSELLQTSRLTLLTEHLSPTEWAEKVERAACTLEEAYDPAFGYFERGMSWTAFGRGYASSVLADLGRAVRINPAYESMARPYIAAAHRELANERPDSLDAG